MKIVIIGATGLIGNRLVDNLIQLNSKMDITTISRKKIQNDSNNLNQIIYPDLSVKTLSNLQISADHFVCCLGTTIKKAKTKDNFKKVDLDLVIEFSKMAKRSNAKSLHVVSSKGSNYNSLFFYSRVKGEMEKEIKSLSIPSVYIYRPSLLIGEREEKRAGENFGIKSYRFLKKILPISLQKQIGSEVNFVIEKMAEGILGHKNGIHIIESSEF